MNDQAGAALTHDEVAAIEPGERITVTRQDWDGIPYTREGTVCTRPVLHGYYYAGQQGTWALYASPGEVATGRLVPALEFDWCRRGMRRGSQIQLTDTCEIHRGWGDDVEKTAAMHEGR